jgi:prevent-host-death family protein
MTTIANITEAKAKLSALIEAALNGEEVIIARAGKPLVKLEPVGKLSVRRFGILKELGWQEEDIPYEVFAPIPEDAIISGVFPDETDEDNAA